jgi:CheY-like chemotaxis protein
VVDVDPEAHPSHQVLIVDDNDDARESLALLMKMHGFDVAPAWSAEDALRHFRQGFRACIVVLDLRMPGMDGWAFWDRMRIDPDLAKIPVLIVSGLAGEAERARERGVCQFLVKPADPADIVAAVERHCRSRPK